MNATQYIPFRTIMTVRLCLFPNEEALLIDAAAVRWSTGRECGLEFLYLRAEERPRLERFIQQHSSQPLCNRGEPT
jgi:hypothetical protein